jgi:Phosphatidate cytidylyltransferase, mitochondrial
MALAEDSNKVDNIVSGSMQLLQDIYTEGILSQERMRYLSLSDDRTASSQKGIAYQTPSPEMQRHWVASLPSVRSIILVSLSETV